MYYSPVRILTSCRSSGRMLTRMTGNTLYILLWKRAIFRCTLPCQVESALGCTSRLGCASVLRRQKYCQHGATMEIFQNPGRRGPCRARD